MERSGIPAHCPRSGLAVVMPVMSKERFAEACGLEVGVVRGMIDRDYLPTVKIGRHRMINVAALQARCLVDDGFGADQGS
ncbi:MAG TPA: hypothetical protein VF275_11330 [Gammaproteobacteria bacterium]